MEIYGGEVMIVGDLHFSDVYSGRHKDYLTECFWILRQLTDRIEQRKPKALVLLGDIVGWQETNIKSRQVLSMFCKILRNWNTVCPVFAVRGNHDMRGYPDFNLFEEFGLLITASACGGYFDYYGDKSQDIPEVRFHLVDYGKEEEALALCEDTSNIVLAHNNFVINGVTTWFAEANAIELGMHQNFCGVDMVIAGHIHNPSPEMFSVTMPNGELCTLFYPGCPMRVQYMDNIWESCWTVHVRYNGKETDIDTEVFDLQPSTEVFYEKEDYIEEDTAEDIERKAALKDVLDDLLKYRISQGSPIDQIQKIPNASQAAKDMACSYLNIALGGVKG